MESKKGKSKKPPNRNQGNEKSSVDNENITKSNNPSTENKTSSKKKRHRKKNKNNTSTVTNNPEGTVINKPEEATVKIIDSTKNPEETAVQIIASNKNTEPTVVNKPEETTVKITGSTKKPQETAIKTIAPVKNLQETTIEVVDSPIDPQISGTTHLQKKTINNEPKISPVIKENALVNIKNDVLNSPIIEKIQGKIIEIKTPTDSIDITNKMEPKSAEKSREEIKAEREAKKLAKQLAKNKPKADKVKNAEISSTVTSITKSVQNISINPSVTNLPDKIQSKQENISIKPTIPTLPDKIQPKQEVVKEKVIEKSEKQANTDDNKKATESLEKSKSELRAERRAKQEAQRAAKADPDKTKVKSDKKENVAPKKKVDSEKIKSSLTDDAKIEMKKSIISDKLKAKSVQNRHKVKLFNHLYTEEENFNIPLNSKSIPPVIVRLGLQYKDHIVVGSNARCIALLRALRIVIKDFIVSPNAIFSRDLEMHIDDCMKFLKSCRPLAVSMDNAIKCIKAKLRSLTHDTKEETAKTILDEYIETYINEQIEVAGKAISNSVNEKITKGDVILTYGCSTLIEKILVDASTNPDKEFSVVVVAANPWNEGREMLRRLTAKNIDCSLVMISALSFIMRKINKVILGAGALLANGYVMARAGTAQVAMVAHAYNVPVLVCCETHKFSERAQTDSFVYNEIGDPDALIKSNPMGNSKTLQNWREIKTLTPLNLTYDVTPPDLVTAVVTELAILPCTSVPVVLRVKPSET